MKIKSNSFNISMSAMKWTYDDNFFLHGKVSYANSTQSFYWHGDKLNCKTQEEFDRFVKMKMFW